MKGDAEGRNPRGKSPRKPSGKGVLRAALIIASAGAALAGLFDLQNFDIWWHLKTGELIVTGGSIPDVDLFSYTVTGQPWITHEWLAEVIFYLVKTGFGFSALIYLKTALLTLSVALLLSLSLRKQGSYLPFLLYPLFLFPIALRPFVRPHIFTLFFTCILLFLLYRWREGGSKKYLYFLPPLFVLWANVHSGVTLGLMIFASFAVGHETARRFFGKEDVPGIGLITKPLIVAFFASLLASLLNPHHVETLIYPFLLARNPVFTRTIAELKSPLSPEYGFSFWQLGFFSLIPVTVLVAWRTRHFRDPASLFPLLIFLVLSFFAHRNVPTFASLALAFTASSAASRKKSKKKSTRSGSKKGWRIPTAVTHALCCVIPVCTILLLIFKGTYMGEDEWRRIGTGLREESYPIGACDFLREAGIEGNVFNRMRYGGYMIYTNYPERKVFIDGRLILYGDEFSRRYLDAYYNSTGVEELVKRYDIDYFLLDYPEENEKRMLQYSLSDNPSWKLVYWDDNSLIYIRNDFSHQGIIDKYGFDIVNPIYRQGFQMGKQAAQNPEAFIAEVERQLAMRPGSSIARVFLGSAYETTGRIREAISEYKKVLVKDPKREDLQNKIFMLRLTEETSAKMHEAEPGMETAAAPTPLAEGLRYLSQSNFEQARDALLEATAQKPDDANAHYNLALAYRGLGDRNLARKSLEKAIEVNPNHVDAYNDLGIIYGMEGRYDVAINQFEMALKVDPDNIQVLYNYSIALEKSGNIDRAIENLEKILSIDPGYRKAAKRLKSYKERQQ